MAHLTLANLPVLVAQCRKNHERSRSLRIAAVELRFAHREIIEEATHLIAAATFPAIDYRSSFIVRIEGQQSVTSRYSMEKGVDYYRQQRMLYTEKRALFYQMSCLFREIKILRRQPHEVVEVQSSSYVLGTVYTDATKEAITAKRVALQEKIEQLCEAHRVSEQIQTLQQHHHLWRDAKRIK